MELNKDLRIAVLIDADNVTVTYIKEIVEEIAKYGTPTFKRIYADWTKPNVTAWKQVLLEHAITPIQQYGYTTGKNSTDSAMIIDAMDILYSDKVEGFCIISSDSDFTRLAVRLREAGMKVIGMGEKKTPISFMSACDKFIYLEILKPIPVVVTAPTKGRIPRKPLPVETSLNKIDGPLIKLISDSITDLADENGWAFLGDLGNLLLKKQPNFDPRNYGFAKMLTLIKSIPKFAVDARDTGKNNIKLIYIKIK